MDKSKHPHVDFEKLEARVGRAHLRHRMSEQLYHSSRVFGHGMTYFHFENLTPLHLLIHLILRGTGLYNRGNRNAQAIRKVENEVKFDRLPKGFDGFRILHLTDLHLDMDINLTDALLERLQGAQYDICVMTGDFRAATHGSYEETVRQAERLIEQLEPPLYGVLGNHDFIEIVPYLETMGVTMLLNESVPIQRGEEQIVLAGIDDIHFYRTDNFHKACDHVKSDDFSIVLSHSPESYREAASNGFDFMLSGHTHGGQICLPFGIPVFTNGRCPRRMAKGNWKYRDLRGYTSPGASCSSVPVRYWCPPEITFHTLRKA